MLDLTKPIECVDGSGQTQTFTLVTANGRMSDRPILGYVGNDYYVAAFANSDVPTPGLSYLRNVDEQPKRLRLWANDYDDGIVPLVHLTLKDATDYAGLVVSRIAVPMVEQAELDELQAKIEFVKHALVRSERYGKIVANTPDGELLIEALRNL